MDLAAAVFDFDEASESECLVRKTKVSPCTACRTDAGSKRRKSSSTPDALKTWDWACRLLDVLQGDSTFCKYETVNLFYRVHWQCLCRERGGVGNASDIISVDLSQRRGCLNPDSPRLTSFVREPPWNLISLLQFLIVPASVRSGAVVESRQIAATMLQKFDQGKFGDVGGIGCRFLQTTHRSALKRWANSQDKFMDLPLFRALLAYASSLNVMQRLEAKHHLVQAGAVVVLPQQGNRERQNVQSTCILALVHLPFLRCSGADVFSASPGRGAPFCKRTTCFER